MTIFFVRHGESTWNAQGRYQGRCDPPLSERGKAQAGTLADRFAAEPAAAPRAVVSSPLSRARETAERSARALGLNVAIDDRLVEISHGHWEGLLKTEVAVRWPHMLEAWRTSPQTVRFPGGESLDDVQRRFRSFIERADAFESPLLVVTHDVIVRLAVLDARGEGLSAFNAIASENAAITQIEKTAGTLRLICLNERAHLGPHRVDPSLQAL